MPAFGIIFRCVNLVSTMDSSQFKIELTYIERDKQARVTVLL